MQQMLLKYRERGEIPRSFCKMKENLQIILQIAFQFKQQCGTINKQSETV